MQKQFFVCPFFCFLRLQIYEALAAMTELEDEADWSFEEDNDDDLDTSALFLTACCFD